MKEKSTKSESTRSTPTRKKVTEQAKTHTERAAPVNVVEHRTKSDTGSQKYVQERVGSYKKVMVSPGERHNLIQFNAYLLAEKRGFCNGTELDDWLEAEKIVDRQLNDAV
ncbi:MAG: DUF2934 domain-containing protein [Oligoflexales bacterium]|nr:DUF2934 domain-containing protein [Oligoflexales bacterium]